MTRKLIAVLCASCLLAGTAWAAFKTGNYNGTTGKGAGVSFTARSKAVKNFTFSVLLRCSNGAQISNTTKMSRIPVRNDRFGATSGTATVKGELKGSNASGTVSVTQPSAASGKNCKSGSVAWTAKRGGTSNAGALVCAPSGGFNGGDLQVSMSCGAADFDAFVVRIPRPATRADTSVAHLKCFAGKLTQNGKTSDVVNCSAQDGVRLKSGQVLIRFSDNATCADANKSTVSALRTGKAEDGPFPLRTTGC